MCRARKALAFSSAMLYALEQYAAAPIPFLSLMPLYNDSTTDILIFDVETTGLDPEVDQIVELSCQYGLGPSCEPATWRMKPDVPIKPDAAEVHGITMGDLEGEPPFRDCAEEFVPLFEEAEVIVGYNVEFDIQFLENECRRNTIELDLWEDKAIVDLYKLWLRQEQRRLADAHVRFVGYEADGQHSAAGDVRATAAILDGMVREFELESNTWRDLSSLCFPERACWIGPSRHIQWKGDQAVITFGKHQGTPLTKLARKEPGYLEWMWQRSSLPPHVKNIARGALSAASAEEFHRALAEHFGAPSAVQERSKVA